MRSIAGHVTQNRLAFAFSNKNSLVHLSFFFFRLSIFSSSFSFSLLSLSSFFYSFTIFQFISFQFVLVVQFFLLFYIFFIFCFPSSIRKASSFSFFFATLLFLISPLFSFHTFSLFLSLFLDDFSCLVSA